MVFAASCALVYVLLRLKPQLVLTQAVVVFVVVLGLREWFHPARIYRRMAGTCLALAAAFSSTPFISARLELDESSWIEFAAGKAAWITAYFLAAAVAFGLMEFFRTHRTVTSGTSETKTAESLTVASGNQSQAAGGDIIKAEAGATIQVTKGGASQETLDLIVKRYESDISERDHQLDHARSTLCGKEEELKTLKAALGRVTADAEKGNLKAKEAIDEARRTGDVEKVQAALIAEADCREQEIKAEAVDYIELCREIAAIAYLRGDLPEAHLRLEALLRLSPDDIDANNRMGHMHKTRGQLDAALNSYRRVLDLSLRQGNEEGQAVAYGNLAPIYRTRGDLDRAEQMNHESLEINKKLGRLEGIANNYGNLGRIYETRGDTNRAAAMHHKSLEINKKLGRLEDMAKNYGNLGVIYQMRDDLDRAEEMHRRSLEIDKKLGRLEGVGITYGNFGGIYLARGNLDRAEEMYRKALKIDEKLGHMEGVANHYANLGMIYQTRGDLEQARCLWTKARDLYEKIGIKHMILKMDGLLSGLEDDG